MPSTVVACPTKILMCFGKSQALINSPTSLPLVSRPPKQDLATQFMWMFRSPLNKVLFHIDSEWATTPVPLVKLASQQLLIQLSQYVLQPHRARTTPLASTPRMTTWCNRPPISLFFLATTSTKAVSELSATIRFVSITAKKSRTSTRTEIGTHCTKVIHFCRPLMLFVPGSLHGMTMRSKTTTPISIHKMRLTPLGLQNVALRHTKFGGNICRFDLPRPLMKTSPSTVRSSGVDSSTCLFLMVVNIATIKPAEMPFCNSRQLVRKRRSPTAPCSAHNKKRGSLKMW